MSRPEFIEVQKYLSGMDYPASKNNLIEHARKQNAPHDVLEALQSLPEREYDGPNAVSSAVAKSS